MKRESTSKIFYKREEKKNMNRESTSKIFYKREEKKNMKNKSIMVKAR
jgi:hypothetical protein